MQLLESKISLGLIIAGIRELISPGDLQEKPLQALHRACPQTSVTVPNA